ncbi:hypothetical protein Emin_0516 [Elusimicrobium minutum Pei191]|uniref:Lipoprotein n=1 Tax=Elusimicrobium minutum (strain Pei191) TaxID=445932 RepID=B2KCF0_ELUMP|nr:hypothetical protein [Elusimicrobium minutum]ACC98071.1 hypothetical protein Emin_0516 [Elusimicrobium minutum Pei191]
MNKKIISLFLFATFTANVFALSLPDCQTALKNAQANAAFKFDFEGDKKEEFFLLCKEDEQVSSKIVKGKKVLSSAKLSVKDGQFDIVKAIPVNYDYGAGKKIVMVEFAYLGVLCKEQRSIYLFVNKGKIESQISAPYNIGCVNEKTESQVIFNTNQKTVMVYQTYEKHAPLENSVILAEQYKKLQSVADWNKDFKIVFEGK